MKVYLNLVTEGELGLTFAKQIRMYFTLLLIIMRSWKTTMNLMLLQMPMADQVVEE